MKKYTLKQLYKEAVAILNECGFVISDTNELCVSTKYMARRKIIEWEYIIKFSRNVGESDYIFSYGSSPEIALLDFKKDLLEEVINEQGSNPQQDITIQ